MERHLSNISKNRKDLYKMWQAHWEVHCMAESLYKEPIKKIKKIQVDVPEGEEALTCLTW